MGKYFSEAAVIGVWRGATLPNRLTKTDIIAKRKSRKNAPYSSTEKTVSVYVVQSTPTSTQLGCPRRANKISAPSSCPLAESFLFWNLRQKRWREGIYGNLRVASKDLTYLIKSKLKAMKQSWMSSTVKSRCLMYLGNTNCSKYHWMTAVDARSNLKTSSQHDSMFGERCTTLSYIGDCFIVCFQQFLTWRLTLLLTSSCWLPRHMLLRCYMMLQQSPTRCLRPSSAGHWIVAPVPRGEHLTTSVQQRRSLEYS